MARSPAAAARLEAAAAAKRLHRALDLTQRTIESEGAVDVFDAIAELDIELPCTDQPSGLVAALQFGRP